MNEQSNKRCYSCSRRSSSVAAVDNPTNAESKITNTKLYVPVVTLSNEDDNKLLEQLKTGFRRTLKWNCYRPDMVIRLKLIY